MASGFWRFKCVEFWVNHPSAALPVMFNKSWQFHANVLGDNGYDELSC